MPGHAGTDLVDYTRTMVVAGMALPLLRERLSPGRLVLVASLLAFAAMALLGISRHWSV